MVIFLLKKFKKMTRGKQIGVIVTAVIILLLVAYVIYTNFKPEALTEYNVSKIYRGDIQTTYETKGTVSSDNTVSYMAVNGVKVKEVFVAVGDRVQKGDKLATFDTSSLSATLNEYGTAYEKAKSAYNKSVSDTEQAKKNLEITKLKIEQLDAEIEAIQNSIDNPDSNSAGDIISSVVGGDVESVLLNSKSAKEYALQQKQSQRQMLDAELSLYEMQAQGTAVDIYKTVMESKKTDYDNYKALVNGLSKGWTADADGIITTVNVVAGEPFNPSSNTSTTTDISALLGLVSGDADMSSILNEIMGSVSGNNTGLGTGIVLEDSGEFIAEFSVGKYDLLNIKNGQKVKVSSLGNSYEGEVIYVSATASESSSIDISSLASTFTGSSTSSSNGALVKIKIKNPDEKVIIGFDVDISIDTAKISDVLVMPIDAVITEDGSNYVFVVNEDNEVQKREVSVGSYSDDYYELLEGVEVGELVIDNPKSSIVDGDKIKIKDILSEK